MIEFPGIIPDEAQSFLQQKLEGYDLADDPDTLRILREASSPEIKQLAIDSIMQVFSDTDEPAVNEHETEENNAAQNIRMDRRTFFKGLAATGFATVAAYKGFDVARAQDEQPDDTHKSTPPEDDTHAVPGEGVQASTHESEELEDHGELSPLGNAVMYAMFGNFLHIVGNVLAGGEFTEMGAARSIGFAYAFSGMLNQWGNEADKEFAHHLKSEIESNATLILALPALTHTTEYFKLDMLDLMTQKLASKDEEPPDATTDTDETVHKRILKRAKDFVLGIYIGPDDTRTEEEIDLLNFLEVNEVQDLTLPKLESAFVEDKLNQEKLKDLESMLRKQITLMVSRGNALGFVVSPSLTTYMGAELGIQLGDDLYDYVARLESIRLMRKKFDVLQENTAQVQSVLLKGIRSQARYESEDRMNSMNGYYGMTQAYFGNLSGVPGIGDPPNFFAVKLAAEGDFLGRYLVDSNLQGAVETMLMGWSYSADMSMKLIENKRLATAMTEGVTKPLVKLVQAKHEPVDSFESISKTSSVEFFKGIDMVLLQNSKRGLKTAGQTVKGLFSRKGTSNFYNRLIHGIPKEAQEILDRRGVENLTFNNLSEVVDEITTSIPQSGNKPIQFYPVVLARTIIPAFGNTAIDVAKTLGKACTKENAFKQWFLLNTPHREHEPSLHDRLQQSEAPLVDDVMRRLVYLPIERSSDAEAFSYYSQLVFPHLTPEDLQSDGSKAGLMFAEVTPENGRHIRKVVTAFHDQLQAIDENTGAETRFDGKDLKKELLQALDTIFTDEDLERMTFDLNRRRIAQYARENNGYTITEPEMRSGYTHSAREVMLALLNQIPHVPAIVELAKKGMKQLQGMGASYEHQFLAVAAMVGVTSAHADNVAAFLFGVATYDALFNDYADSLDMDRDDERIKELKYQSFLMAHRVAVYEGKAFKPGNGPNFKLSKKIAEEEPVVFSAPRDDMNLYREFFGGREVVVQEDPEILRDPAKVKKYFADLEIHMTDEEAEDLILHRQNEEVLAHSYTPTMLENGMVNTHSEPAKMISTYGTEFHWGVVNPTPTILLGIRAGGIIKQMQKARD